MHQTSIYIRLKNKIWSIIVQKSRSKRIYFYLYRSYWNSLFVGCFSCEVKRLSYLSARPNPGAGIGHQLANWISGYWWAKQFGLNFVHLPFTPDSWNSFLGLGESSPSVTDLCRNQGYKKVRLPLFDENNLNEIATIKKIIRSYENKKVVFICEQDQGYKAQIGVMEDIKYKFYNAKSRKNDIIKYDVQKFNIAVHIRRGDIVAGQTNQNPNLLMRWQNDDYYHRVLEQLTTKLKSEKEICIYIFSQGVAKDFEEYRKYGNVKLCNDWSAMDSFLHLIYADLLVTSKSSFSYKPALISNGIKICPKDFWHDYPNESKWILADENGIFDYKLLKEIFRN